MKRLRIRIFVRLTLWALFFLLSSCGFQPPQETEHSVTPIENESLDEVIAGELHTSDEVFEAPQSNTSFISIKSVSGERDADSGRSNAVGDIQIHTDDLGTWTYNESKSVWLRATGGDGRYQWEVDRAPIGLSLDLQRRGSEIITLLKGRPRVLGRFQITISVSDRSENRASQTVPISITEDLNISAFICTVEKDDNGDVTGCTEKEENAAITHRSSAELSEGELLAFKIVGHGAQYQWSSSNESVELISRGTPDNRNASPDPTIAAEEVESMIYLKIKDEVQAEALRNGIGRVTISVRDAVGSRGDFSLDTIRLLDPCASAPEFKVKAVAKDAQGRRVDDFVVFRGSRVPIALDITGGVSNDYTVSTRSTLIFGGRLCEHYSDQDLIQELPASQQCNHGLKLCRANVGHTTPWSVTTISPELIRVQGTFDYDMPLGIQLKNGTHVSCEEVYEWVTISVTDNVCDRTASTLKVFKVEPPQSEDDGFEALVIFQVEEAIRGSKMRLELLDSAGLIAFRSHLYPLFHRDGQGKSRVRLRLNPTDTPAPVSELYTLRVFVKYPYKDSSNNFTKVGIGKIVLKGENWQTEYGRCNSAYEAPCEEEQLEYLEPIWIPYNAEVSINGGAERTFELEDMAHDITPLWWLPR